jgi:hypothetical protein
MTNFWRAMLLECAAAVAAVASDTITWSWVTPNFTFCEGVGIHGSYRVTARALVNGSGTNRTIDQITAFASSAAFSPSDTTLAVQLQATSVPAPVRAINLVAQPPNSVGEAPQPNETPRLFLPAGTQIALTPNLKLRFSVSATIQRTTGSCAVGATVKDIDPSQAPDAAGNRSPASVKK